MSRCGGLEEPGQRFLNILVVNWLDRRNPRAGGAETHLHEVFGRLASRGHDVTLLCSGWPGAPERDELDGIEVVRSGHRYTFGLTAPVDYRDRLGGRAFDVAVEDLNKVPLFVRSWARAGAHAAVVHHLFGATAFRAANPLVAGVTWLLERLVPAMLDGIPCVAVSPSTRDDLVGRGVTAERVRVIPNGVDVTVARYGAERFPRPTAIYLGRLRPYKGVDLLLRAAKELGARGTDVDVIVAGEGDDRPRLEALARELGLESRVTFTGFVTEEQKQDLLARSWVHVYPSPKEGWGITNLEAAAAGTATVASDAPGLRDSVEDGETGFLVEHGNVEALAEAMERLLEPPVRDRMGARARVFAEGYDWDRITDAFDTWLAEVARPAATAEGGWAV